MIPNNFYLYWTGTEFSIHHYLCVKSIVEVEQAKVFLYYRNPIPNNDWWKRTSELVTLRELDFDELNETNLDIDFNSLTPNAQSNLFRCLVLYKFGGIYTDFDTLVIKSIRSQIGDANVFLPQCRYATSVWNEGRYIPVKKRQHKRYSHIANGNLGSTAGHSFFRTVLDLMAKDISKGTFNKNRMFHYIPLAYEPNKENLSDVKLMPWWVFHVVEERSRNQIDMFKGPPSLSINEFFQADFKEIPEQSCVLHYYSSKIDCTRLLAILATPYAMFCSTSTYARYACKLLGEFLRGWKKDGFIISPGRDILERKIIPHLTGDICFVGVASYVRHYWTDVFPPDTRVTTIDVNKRVKKYGAKIHLVGDMKRLAKLSQQRYDYVVMHGIAGFGSSTVTILQYAFLGSYKALKPGGLLIYGWANHLKFRIAHPTYFPKKSFGTDDFKAVTFRELGIECKANDFIDPNRDYNVSIKEAKNMDVRFMFFKKPEET